MYNFHIARHNKKMEKVKVKLDSLDDIAMLVARADEVKGDVILSRGRFSVDGRSLLGALSIGWSEPFTVEYTPDEQFSQYLKPYIK